MASTYIQRTNGTPDSRRKFTFSVWVKRAKLGTYQYIHGFQDNGVGDPRMTINFRDDDSFEYNEGNAVGTTLGRLRPSMKFRDTSGWYAITVSVDTTNATADDRIKIWVNGEQQTSINTRVNYTQNTDTCINDNRHTIGAIYNNAISGYFDGSLSHYHYCDGYSYQASDFGEYDANGVWKIKTSPSVTYGANGCFVLKDGNSVTDQSGNGNNFTVAGGTLTNTEDNPSNVFATLNPNYQSTFHSTSRAILANGNTKWTGTSDSTSQNGILSTLGASTGKWYLEVKWKGTYDCKLGVAKDDFGMMTTGTGGFESEGWYGMITNIGSGMIWYSNNSATGDTGSALSSNDIIMMAIDLDNSKLYFGKNGTWEESGDPTSGATGTGATSTLASNTTYLVGCSNLGYSTANSWEFNFGNGYFGTTAVASAGTNASGNGIFEYDCPNGYTALSTKGLNL